MILELVFPSCNLEKETIQNAEIILDSANIKLLYNNNQNFPFSSDAHMRAQELERGFLNKVSNIIICARGGYGCNQITEYVDWQLIKDNYKPFLGFSDATTLLNRVYKETGKVTYHSPMISSIARQQINKRSFSHFIDFLHNNIVNYDESFLKNISILRKGEAISKLVGGNLTTICSDIGTDNEVLFKGNILFLEDVDEELYRIDRMLYQLKSRGIFKQIKGLILGEFCKIPNRKIKLNISLQEIIRQYCDDLNIPIIYNFPAGHGKNNLILKIGALLKMQINDVVNLQYV